MRWKGGSKFPMNKDVFKLPNVLSLLRILFSVVLYLLFMQHYRGNIEVSPLLIFILYVVIALTDLVDGVIARRMGTVTELGKELDPMADKVLVFLILFAFFRIHILPLWVILPVFLRDIFVHSLRRRARMLGLSFKTSGPAKAKTAVQMLFIGFVLAIPVILSMPVSERLYNSLADYMTGSGIVISMFIIMLFTVYTGIDYYIKYRRSFHGE